jgi:hypothetical protein
MDEEEVLGVWHVAWGREKRNTQGLGEEIYRKDDTKVDLNELE